MNAPNELLKVKRYTKNRSVNFFKFFFQRKTFMSYIDC